MGKIIQLETKKYLLSTIESNLLNIINWRMIIPESTNNNIIGIEIYINNKVFFIEDMTIDVINKINLNNEKCYRRFHYIRGSLLCSKCGGMGTTDWIDKITESRISCNYKHTYTRDKKTQIESLYDLYKKEVFISKPMKKFGDEYCSKCYGCGIKFSTPLTSSKSKRN